MEDLTKNESLEDKKFPLTPGPLAAKEEVNKPQEGFVSVPANEWQEIKDTVKRLRDGGIEKIKKVTDRISYARVYDGKIVTKILKTWTARKFSELNPAEEDRLYAEIEVEGGKKFKIDFVDFLNESDKIYGNIKKIDKKDVSRNHGEIMAENPDPANVTKKKFDSFPVELIEEKTDDNFTMEINGGLRAGEIITLNHSVLNL